MPRGILYMSGFYCKTGNNKLFPIIGVIDQTTLRFVHAVSNYCYYFLIIICFHLNWTIKRCFAEGVMVKFNNTCMKMNQNKKGGFYSWVTMMRMMISISVSWVGISVISLCSFMGLMEIKGPD